MSSSFTLSSIAFVVSFVTGTVLATPVMIRHKISEYVCNDLPPCCCIGFVVYHDFRCNIVVNFHKGWFVLVKNSIRHDSYLLPV